MPDKKEKNVRSNSRIDLYLATAVIVLLAFAGLLTVCMAEESQTDKSNANGKCHVCHPSMKTEDISTIHVARGVTCDVCHGASTEHMHDEMLMTKPDLLFGRSEVRNMCSKCHKGGEGQEFYSRQEHKNPAAVEEFITKWTGRMRPSGRAVSQNSICTDCHGTHNIAKPLKTQSEDAQSAEWIPAFNGRDLAGWQYSGGASWAVKAGRIVGTPGDKAATLWTETEYENYLLAVTFRATWPIRAGIWLHGSGSKPGPRVEIFEPSDKSRIRAYTGSVLLPGKGLALANLRENLVERESWNTLSVRVEGKKIQVWLNGEEIGAVQMAEPEKGKIGLYIGKQTSSETAELAVREV
ncbi:MAG: family 16 glycoside hydrolase, partial [Planctomycetota bacterium]